MTFSEPLLATDKKGTTLNWWEYWIGHCWMTGWQSIKMTFWIWRDLMSNNYEGYALLKEDDPEAECIEWFWASLNEDDVYPKEFLEYLQELASQVDRGDVKTYSLEEIQEILERVDSEETVTLSPSEAEEA